MQQLEPGQPTARGFHNPLVTMSLLAIGIVFGDIGTSPLYAVRESFHPGHGITIDPLAVMGVLSLIFWALILVVSVKYMLFILRADNDGEGGIVALTALVSPILATRSRGWLFILLGVFGSALLYGDGMITPAISVLSAVEGLQIVTPALGNYVVPITVAILIGLFWVQSHGTATVGKYFAPVMLLWFFSIAALGVWQIVQHPAVFAAASPSHAVHFILQHKWESFVVLGSVFLVVTGGESMYSDLGHLGRTPIRLAWFFVALPALLLNYFGQGALLLRQPEAFENPFFLMAPRQLLLPLVILATAAAVIASQALITGVFSLTMQAAQLGFIPRILVRHTSTKEMGQIYVGSVNWLLLVACIALVLGFRSSSNMTAAYGVAVSTTMVITTTLFYVVARTRWKWHPVLVAVLCGGFLLIDFGFWLATLIKIPHGGWFPLLIGLVGFLIMTTWKKGRGMLATRLRNRLQLIFEFVNRVETQKPQRVPGVAVFMTSNPTGTPPAMQHSFKHFGVLHETIALVSIETEEVPYHTEKRVDVEHLGERIFSVIAHFGFMEEPDVPGAIAGLELDGVTLDPGKVTYFLGRENLVAANKPGGMALWRENLFVAMSRNAQSAARYFHLPADQVVELGIQVEL